MAPMTVIKYNRKTVNLNQLIIWNLKINYLCKTIVIIILSIVEKNIGTFKPNLKISCKNPASVKREENMP